MNFRPVAGVATGFILWWVLFMAIGIAFGIAWPAYRAAAHLMFEKGDFSLFSTTMLFLNWVLFTIDGLATGWLVSFIARNRIAVLVLALVALAYMGFNHFYLVWGKLPDWYNIIVPFVIAGSIATGGLLTKKAGNPAA